MPGDICGLCLQPIRVAIFKGSGHCSENHRKILSGEVALDELESKVA